MQTVCHGRERINNRHFHFLFMVLITDDKTSRKYIKKKKKERGGGGELALSVRLKCLCESLLGNEGEVKLWRICKCV